MRSHMQVCSLRMSETSQCYLSASGMRRHQSMSGWVFFFGRLRFNHIVYHTKARFDHTIPNKDTETYPHDLYET